jgi:tight adherence protein C
MLIAAIAAGFAATVFAACIVFLSFRSDALRRLAEVDSNNRDQLQSRVITRLLSGVNTSVVGARLSEAGWYTVTVQQFVLSRSVTALVGVALGALLTTVTGHSRFLLVGTVVLGTLGFVAPSFVVDSAIKKRKEAIARRIPDLLDMVSTTVEAGTALGGALATAATSLAGPLSEEIKITLSDIRLGRSRSDAFNAMGQRVKQPDLSAMVMAIVQTERLGGNIGAVLDELAQEARASRLARAEEIAARLPVLMILPMAFFMLPALFVMIFTPVIAQLMASR